MDSKTTENVMMLSYDRFGHYAPHYDFLNFSTDSDNWWYKTYGDRLATALFIIKTAEKGGGTVFPKMKVVISPEPGDMILWFNANIKFEQEDLSFHGACPILAGRKIAMSLWIRCRQHKDLKCQMNDKILSHELNDIIRNFD
uniref:Fe2OG dioxygenase domain-containing protein n=1 Tax=Panagrolaimus davidi TaxID=227884 RepID=A0A914PAV1_9BILA